MFEIASEVREAIAAGRPVVALESSIIAHGLPHPANIETARELEAIVRSKGAVPATVGIVEGVARVGLDASSIDQLGDPDRDHAKAGAADIAALIASGSSAGTTVSATAFLAAKAGVRVFATGGIGGVHRGFEADVSSDLGALARTSIAVVSSGPKSILDLPRTLELLETLGVLVVGYNTTELPAFYSRSSGLELEHSASSIEALARIASTRFDVLGQGGMLIANPVAAADEISPEVLEPAIEKALAEADRKGVNGKALTPFLLAELRGALGSAALECNRALVKENTMVAADLAAALCEH